MATVQEVVALSPSHTLIDLDVQIVRKRVGAPDEILHWNPRTSSSLHVCDGDVLYVRDKSQARDVNFRRSPGSSFPPVLREESNTMQSSPMSDRSTLREPEE